MIGSSGGSESGAHTQDSGFRSSGFSGLGRVAYDLVFTMLRFGNQLSMGWSFRGWGSGFGCQGCRDCVSGFRIVGCVVSSVGVEG